jgi:hypothetical protein
MQLSATEDTVCRCSSVAPLSVCRMRLKALVLNTVTYFLANKSQVRLDGDVRYESFLDKGAKRLHIDLE